MSESEKRTPISVYLTPKAAMILQEYNMGSGYGSVSRTVEEIILAFDMTYKTVKDTFASLSQYTGRKPMSNDDKVVFFVIFLTSLQNINNAVSRLQPASAEVGRGV